MAVANPYSAAAMAGLGPECGAERDFLAHWDALEALVIAVYRQGAATRADEAAWRELAGWLGPHYGAHAPALGRYWPATRAGGEALTADPFRALLASPRAAAFVDNRAALRLLPAARETLNRWLLALSGEEAETP